MPGAVLPPYGSPSGPELSLEGVVDAVLEVGRTGFSEELHIEDEMLLADRMVTVGVRLGSRALLLRGDVPPGVDQTKEGIEGLLGARGLSKLEPDARLGDIAAIQITGIRGAVWDLWGEDAEQARRDLERAAVGGETLALQLTEGPGHDWGAGMTLDELLDDINQEDRGK